MKRKTLTILSILVAITTLGGCKSESSSSSDYTTITAIKAKKMMEDDSEIIILDVRSEDEYNTGYIKGALLIPDNEIAEKAVDTLTDKSATILVYCRSGRRSALAAKELSELGYSNIYDFGGINDWEYDIVTK